MKWIQTHDTAYTHTFELETDASIIINVSGKIQDAVKKLKKAFGADVEILTFDDMED